MKVKQFLKSLCLYMPIFSGVIRERDKLRADLNISNLERMDLIASLQRLELEIDSLKVQSIMQPTEHSSVQIDEYQNKLNQEKENFKKNINVHDLPAIFHYWSNKYLKPLLNEVGIESIDLFFANYLLEASKNLSEHPRFISIGSGNCELEIRVAVLLKEKGLKDFTLECLELNSEMLDRGRQDAISKQVSDVMDFVSEDFNFWQPSKKYSAVIANHSLHHVTNLEGLFDAIKSSLNPNGYFVINDMIGRNGHQRWPEALVHLNKFWQELPETYKFNRSLNRLEPDYINWDCSSEGFEGIRAEDILPLLIQRFDFYLFVPFANIISVFIDRCFGHNFDPNSESDCSFIDRIHALDEELFQSGEIKPTQMFAVLTPCPCDTHIYSRGLSPIKSLRQPDKPT